MPVFRDGGTGGELPDSSAFPNPENPAKANLLVVLRVQ
jgi:hypothetical protein